MRKVTEGRDRVTDLDGGVYADWISAADAKALTVELNANGDGWKWERYGGERTGWNGVSAHFPPTAKAASV